MNVLIIGAGAIGCMLSARMAAAGQRVTLIARSDTADAVRANGVRLVEATGREHVQRIEVADQPTDAFSGAMRFDLAIVAVKAYDTAALAGALHAAHPTSLPLLTIQNGLGNEETFADALGAPIFAGALTTPVELLAPGQVRIARSSHKFAVAPGPRAEDARQVATLFGQSGFETQVAADWRALKWCKLLMNILANAQAAILGLTPAQIFAQPALGNLEVEAWREAMAVMQALGIRPVSLAGYPFPLIVPLVRALPVAWVRPVLGRFIAGGRGGKLPSLTYDVSPTPRGRSEVNWLNGAVVAHAHRLGMRAPVNETLTRVLLDLVEGRKPTSARGSSMTLHSATPE
jgi:2-dehydropantoate 2-reductase